MIMLYTPEAGSSITRFEASLYRDHMSESLQQMWGGSGVSTSIWFIPGTQPEDRVQAQALDNWAFDGFLGHDLEIPLDRVEETEINVAKTMVFHAPKVGTYSVWMIPGVKHAEFERQE